MSELSEMISGGLGQYMEDLSEKVHELIEDLSDNEIWTKPYPYGNSIGHLILHLTGNFNHFFGHVIGGTDFQRDRDREFTETNHLSKTELLNNFDMAVETTLSIIYSQNEESWSLMTSAGGTLAGKNRFELILFCAGHFFNHIGQMIYLIHELKRD